MEREKMLEKIKEPREKWLKYEGIGYNLCYERQDNYVS